MYKAGFAYRNKATVNWDPVDKTVLANEQVDAEGRSWRSGAFVEEKEIDSWYFGITQKGVADKLFDGLQSLNWPQKVLNLQKQWIGRSEGIEFDFEIVNSKNKIKVFTTKADTLEDVTFLALAEDHEIVKEFKRKNKIFHNLEKCFLGMYVLHPKTGVKLPVYVADYVLSSYGSGAVMGVPKYDQRDNAFIREMKKEESVSLEEYVFDEKKHTLAEKLGRVSTQYKMRDWLVSRQRLWGTPIPVVDCETCGFVLEEKENLPVKFPEVFYKLGRSEIDRILASKQACSKEEKTVLDFVYCKCPKCTSPARREIDTLDTFVDSSFYYLLFCNQDLLTKKRSGDIWFDDIVFKWMKNKGVDLYIGGIEHAVLHLLYARFINLVLFQEGHIKNEKPFNELLTQGMVLGKTYKSIRDGRYLLPDEVKQANPDELQVVFEKMSKSKQNGVDPTELVAKYGSDVVRLFTLFAAPPEKEIQFEENGLHGQVRLLNRIFKFVNDVITSQGKETVSEQVLDNLERELNSLIQDFETVVFIEKTLNVAIARLMKFFNMMQNDINAQEIKCSNNERFVELLKDYLLLLWPFAPSFCEQMFQELKSKNMVDSIECVYPKERKLKTLKKLKPIKVILQINGKKRGIFDFAGALDEKKVVYEATKQFEDTILKFSSGRELKKTVLVKNQVEKGILFLNLVF
eukprot:snap_masked-scaffold_4-processed-gene-10.27-mRNA-1 protein AED:0.13 eAED:0.13 QI:0/0/0/1/1/1/2/0/685